MGDDELVFTDTADEALSSEQPRRHLGDQTVRTSGPAFRRKPKTRRPPDPAIAARPHCLVGPVLPEPLLLSRSRRYVVGRDVAASVRIRSGSVSRRHAEVFWDGRCFVVRDLSSTNGTLLNGHEVEGECPVYGDDRLEFGDYELTVRVLRPGEVPEDHGDEGSEGGERTPGRHAVSTSAPMIAGRAKDARGDAPGYPLGPSAPARRQRRTASPARPTGVERTSSSPSRRARRTCSVPTQFG